MDDWSPHLIVARKALANAEALAALHRWRQAAAEMRRAIEASNECARWLSVAAAHRENECRNG